MTKEPWVEVLVEWYERQARALPWREDHDPYRIWISEVMLQQTQVAAVLPYYRRFLIKFPTLTALANAEEPQVLTAWSGLGYYTRAKNLHRGAKYILKVHGGKFPRTREEILNVPGIGPYTAGAILSIAYNLPEPLVDGNVQRVFARFFGVREPIHTGKVQKFFWKKAEDWVSAAQTPRFLNQALMELGAIVCVKSSPRCPVCPLSTGCVAFKKNWQAELPVKKIQREKVDLFWMGLVLQSKGKIFLRKNKPGEWWSDLWDFPRIELESSRQLPKRLAGVLETFPGVKLWKELTVQRHTVTHHRIRVAPFFIELGKPRQLPDEGSWFSIEELEDIPVSSLVKKVLRSDFH
jgi:A/G-specific adenine glycosylase